MRWKYFIPTVVIIVLITAFNILFLDMILKNTIISAGEMIFGAKVEVSSLKTKLSNLSISIKGLKAANKNDVFKNVVEADQIAFSVRPLPLLSKKLIINEMSLEGVKWGTSRETSGALPPRKQAKLEKQQKKADKEGFFSKLTGKLMEKGKSEFSQLPALGEVKNAQEQLKGFSLDKTVSANDLQSVKELDTLKQTANEKFIKYQGQIKSFNADDKLKAASAAVSDISQIKISGPQDAEALRSKLDSLNRTREELQKSADEINTMKSRAEADLGAETDLLNKINALKDADIKALSDKYKLPSLNSGGIAKSIFGPVWIGRVEKTMYYIQLARKYMPPSKKGSKQITVQRSKGTDVSFPKADNPPDFLIAKIMVTGTTGGSGKPGTPLDFKGLIQDITSDQAMLGRPTRFALDGSKSPKALKAEGVLDHMTDDPTDTFSFSYDGLTASEMNLPSSEYLPSFDGGSGRINGVFTLRGDKLDASIDLNISGFKLPQADKSDEVKMLVSSLWAGISSISVTAKVSGTMDKLDLSVASNIDKIISDRLGKLYGEKLAEIQNRIRSEVDRLTNEKKAEVTALYNAKRGELMTQYSDKQKEMQDKMSEINRVKDSKQNEVKNIADNAKKQAEDAVNAQKKQAEEKALEEQRKAQAAADAEKNKAEAEASKKAEEQLKGLFGK